MLFKVFGFVTRCLFISYLVIMFCELCIPVIRVCILPVSSGGQIEAM